MITAKKEAFNLKLLKFSSVQLRSMRPVTSLDVFESFNTTDFHDQGLYSTQIFGSVGDRLRDTTFAYVDIKTTIVHPLLVRTVGRLRAMYIEIMEGRTYAVWNDKTKEFDKSSESEGSTGYSFFMSHWNDLVFEKSSSLIRNQRVDLLDLWRETGVYNKILVLPAGLRDVEIGDTGRPREHEINPIYRKMLSISNALVSSRHSNDPIYDRARSSLQSNFNLLYETIERLINGFIEDKWTSRRIVNGTRNVVSSQDPSVEDLDDLSTPDSDSTIMGLWQLTKGALPVSISKLRGGVVEHVFGTVEGGARLIDPVTLISETVQVDSNVYDRWMTSEGLEKVISRQESSDIRHKPVLIEGRYIALVYRPKDRMVFKVFYDIGELPENFSKDDVYPLSNMELIYLCNYRGWNDLRVINTRYPVTGDSSALSSKIFVATTVVSDRRVELTDDWEMPEDPTDFVAGAYPNFTDKTYIDAVKVSPFKIRPAGGDYDGDTFSNNVVFTEEAIREIDKYLSTREAHIDPSGGMRGSSHIDTTEYVLYNLTGDPSDDAI